VRDHETNPEPRAHHAIFIVTIMMSPRYFALIPAAGVGARMERDIPKQYLPVAGKPMLQHVLDIFADTPSIAHTFVVVNADDGYIDAIFGEAGQHSNQHPNVSVLRVGGASRQASVLNGLHAMRAMVEDDDRILVHDAARPGLTLELVEKLIRALHDDEVGGLLALPIVDTIKRANEEERVDATVAREQLWAAQTPQMFDYALLLRALETAQQGAENVTDEASAVEALGLKPKLVEGSSRNFKVTLAHDIALAELFLREAR
jgi:2-C-methyl-D-erythritol 4-phosphate cytidylyltransferase